MHQDKDLVTTLLAVDGEGRAQWDSFRSLPADAQFSHVEAFMASASYEEQCLLANALVRNGLIGLHRRCARELPDDQSYYFAAKLGSYPLPELALDLSSLATNEADVQRARGALDALAHFNDEPSKEVLLKKLSSEHWQLRSAAIASLRARRESSALAGVVPLTTDSNPDVRLSSCGFIRAVAKHCTPELEKVLLLLLDDSDVEVLLCAIGAVADLKVDAALPRLREISSLKLQGVSERAMDAIERIHFSRSEVPDASREEGGPIGPPTTRRT